MNDLITTVEGPIGRIRLNRPKALHALNLAMCEGVLDALEAWRGDASVEAIVVDHAEGRGFCAEVGRQPPDRRLGGDLRLGGALRGHEAASFSALSPFSAASLRASDTDVAPCSTSATLRPTAVDSPT